MDVGIGIPNSVPDATGSQLLEWARRAEAPARSAAELAKQAATVDQLTGGRLTLGLGVGWRQTDYELTGRDFASRGRGFDQQLVDLHRAWRGEPLADGTRPVAPRPAQPDGVPLLIGGTTDAAVRRAVEFGIGWTAGGLPPDAAAQMAEETAQMIAGSALRSPDAVTDTVARFRDTGFDELLLDPTVADPAQVDLLADALR